MPEDLFEFEVAVSFAREDRGLAEQLAERLTQKHLKVFLDEYTPDQSWGKDVIDHLVNLYARKARYCVLLISHHYPLRAWTAAEQTQARERALREADEYIIPIRLDDYEVAGLERAPGVQDLRRQSLQSIVDLLVQKLTGVRVPSGPPPQSHDLRSGNVPPAPDTPDSN